MHWLIDVTHVQVIGPYHLHITFSDGTERKISLEQALYGQLYHGLFLQLLEPSYFAHAYFNPDDHTVSWPNGVTIAPQSLYTDFDPIA
jgi:Protein of unknown function (DUF2442)